MGETARLKFPQPNVALNVCQTITRAQDILAIQIPYEYYAGLWASQLGFTRKSGVPRLGLRDCDLSLLLLICTKQLHAVLICKYAF